MAEDKTLIFISYSHHDRPDCEAVASLMRSPSREVWYDKGLIPGEVYRKKIAETIRNADYFAVLLSKESVKSEWVMDEVEYARAQRKRILPIYIGDTELPDDLAMILQRYHCLFWHLRASDRQFAESLELVFGGGKKAVPADPDRVIPGFIEFSREENDKMRRMLELESRGVYSQCYTAQGACLLGKAYLYGSGCEEDRAKARFYFRIARYRGSPDGSAYLLQTRLEDQEAEIWDEPDEAFCAPIVAELRSLAESGSEAAMMLYAHDLWHGRYGCPRDMVQSARLYEVCAKNGNARAQYIMSSNYYLGEGVEKDYDLAVMYANLALEQGYAKGWRRWGKFYRDGLAVPRDYRKAREYYEKGARAGDYNCYNKIGDMLYFGWGFDVDCEKAFEYYLKGEQAPESGQKYALWKAKQALGRCYETGSGTEKSLETAAEKYLEGYRLGGEECREDYTRCAGSLLKSRSA